jgi:hypothetical protein
VKIHLANPEPSTHGPKLTWGDVRLETVVGTIADINIDK